MVGWLEPCLTSISVRSFSSLASGRKAGKLLLRAEQPRACRFGNIDLVPGNPIEALAARQREDVEQCSADGRSGQALESGEDTDMEFSHDEVVAILLCDDLLDIADAPTVFGPHAPACQMVEI